MAGIGSNIFASGGVSTSVNTDSTLAAATYGPPAEGGTSAFSPRRSQGAGFWLAVAGVAILVCIRQSLPR